MKHLKQLLAAALTMLVALAVATPALAAGEKGSITINNAAIGEKYSIYKVLGATTNASGGIDYTEPIPDSLKDVIAKVSYTVGGVDYIKIGKVDGKSDQEVFDALKAWVADKEGAASYDAIDFDNLTAADQTITATSNTVQFTDIDAGYYVIISSQGEHVVMVDSATDPAAVINEKNETIIIAKEKKVFDEDGNEISSVTIGQPVKYVAKFGTTNYVGTGENAKIVTKYEITDTLPEYMTGVTITSVTVDGTAITPTPAFDENGSFSIDWATQGADGKWTSKYANGAEIVVTYTATVTSNININATSKNTISIEPYNGDEKIPHDEPFQAHSEINTYAAALKKTDGNGTLAGAKFKALGLVVEPTAGYEKGVYTVVSYDADSEDYGTEMEVGADGMLYIIGLAEDVDLTVKETVAPKGYNIMDSTATLEPQVLTTEIHTTTGIRHYDADGNFVSDEVTGGEDKQVTKNLNELDATSLEVINKAGTELPSTGGIGTTIFYVVGGALVITAGVLLVTKRRMANIEG